MGTVGDGEEAVEQNAIAAEKLTLQGEPQAQSRRETRVGRVQGVLFLGLCRAQEVGAGPSPAPSPCCSSCAPHLVLQPGGYLLPLTMYAGSRACCPSPCMLAPGPVCPSPCMLAPGPVAPRLVCWLQGLLRGAAGWPPRGCTPDPAQAPDPSCPYLARARRGGRRGSGRLLLRPRRGAIAVSGNAHKGPYQAAV